MVEVLLALLTLLTGIPRTVDADLSAIAQRRAVEISVNFSHEGWVYGRDGEAEIIAYNLNAADPVATLASQWQSSPPHWAILTDPRFTEWGCGIHQSGTAVYAACLFGSTPIVQLEPPPVGQSPVQPTAPSIQVLPNTAMESNP